MKQHKFIVSPYKHIMVKGKKRASVGFPTKAKAVRFIKQRGLRNAILYKRIKKRR